tara:strand:+ start:1692 stop:2180 length:489 start_codon:yes stop_codon:yes gene_type:complete
MSNIHNNQKSNLTIQDEIINIIDKDDRLKWDQYFIAIALLASKRSTCSRLNVGCVIVKDNRILATGYNGFLRGAPHISRVVDNHEQFTVHAEQNAICDAAYRGVALNSSIAYVTHYPCLTCLKLLIASGIKEIKYLNNYKNNPLTIDMINENKIVLTKLDNN